jgi:disulfide bond formation protein DsbB
MQESRTALTRQPAGVGRGRDSPFPQGGCSVVSIPGYSPHRTRLLAGLVAAACAAALATGLFVQHALGYEPCSLCVLQRLGFMGVLIFAVPLALLRPARVLSLVLAAAVLAAAAGGLAVASYQVWLQAFPPQIASCGRGIATLFDGWPLEEALGWVFEAQGDCTQAVSPLGFVSLAQLGLGAFAMISAASSRLLWLTAGASAWRRA